MMTESSSDNCNFITRPTEREIKDMFPMVLFLDINIVADVNTTCNLTSGLLKQIHGLLVNSEYSTAEVSYICPPNNGIELTYDGFPILSSSGSGPKLMGLDFQNCRMSWKAIIHISKAMGIEYMIHLFDITIIESPQITGENVTVSDKELRIIFNALCYYEQYEVYVGGNYTALTSAQNNACPVKGGIFATTFTQNLRNIPKHSFPQMKIFEIANLDLSSGSDTVDFRFWGPLSGWSFKNTNLFAIPMILFPENRTLDEKDNIRDALIERVDTFRSLVGMPPSSRTLLRRRVNLPLVDNISDRFNVNFLYLRRNNIKSIPDNDQMLRIDVLSLEFNNINWETVGQLERAKNVYELKLTGNPLHILPTNMFHNFPNLEYLNLASCNLETIDTVAWSTLRNIVVVYIDRNKITDIDSIITKTSSLKFLSAEHNNIHCLPKQSQTNLTYLFLRQNSFSKFPSEILAYPKLYYISLAFNQIDTTGIKALLNITRITRPLHEQLRKIDITYNCIEFIPLEGLDDVKQLTRILEVNYILMGGNPLHCGCDEFKQWLNENGVLTTNINCEDIPGWYNPTVYKQYIAAYTKPECPPSSLPYPYRCQSDIRRDRIIIGTILSCVLVVIVVASCTVGRRYNISIRALIYVYTGWRIALRPSRRQDKIVYDAFVCFSGKDENEWVMRTLSKRLEEDTEPPYRLCIHHRDFVIGLDIIANIVNTMEYSAHCIIILSQTSLQSDWGRFEQLNSLWEGGLRNQRNYVIPILFPGVTRREFPLRLRRGLRHVPMLRVGEKHFWRKLKFALRSDRQRDGRQRGLIDETTV